MSSTAVPSITPSPTLSLLCHTFRVVGEGEQADAGGSDPRTEHSDAVGVSAEEADVLADPP